MQQWHGARVFSVPSVSLWWFFLLQLLGLAEALCLALVVEDERAGHAALGRDEDHGALDAVADEQRAGLHRDLRRDLAVGDAVAGLVLVDRPADRLAAVLFDGGADRREAEVGQRVAARLAPDLAHEERLHRLSPAAVPAETDAAVPMLAAEAGAGLLVHLGELRRQGDGLLAGRRQDEDQGDEEERRGRGAREEAEPARGGRDQLQPRRRG